MITRQRDIIYGRKFGMALTMDVFTPAENANGIGVILIISGGWFSSHASIESFKALGIERMVHRGYTVFALVPSSRPRFTIPEMAEDVKRGIRFVRHHSGEYGIDAQRLGLYGFSAGGHLTLLTALTGTEGDTEAVDEIDRESSKVQAAAEFYGPTDFLNYGATGENGLGEGLLGDLKSAFDFNELDPESGRFVAISDEERYLEIGREVSPITHAKHDAPPTFVIHGDQDVRVPVQQSTSFVDKMKSTGATAELLIVPGEAHGWENMDGEMDKLIDWFDLHLVNASGSR
jgi:acetyl esterase/lipase